MTVITYDADRRLMWIFVREIAVQSRFALLAFDGLARLPELVPVFYSGDEGNPDVQPIAPSLGNEHVIPYIAGRVYGPDFLDPHYSETAELAFFLAHAFLAHAAAVSRILEPPVPRNRKGHSLPFTEADRQDRAAALQQALGVDVNLLVGRTFKVIRNSLEHADERLEDWFMTPAGQSLDLIDMNHRPFGSSGIAVQLSESDFFRTLGGQSLGFRFGADLQDLEPMAGELRLVLNAALTWQLRAARDGVRTPPGPGTAMVPTELYMHRERPEAQNIEALERAYRFLHEEGFTPDAEEQSVLTLLELIDACGWSAAVEPHEGLFVAKVTRPASLEQGKGEYTAIADSWSEEAALAFAFAGLLQEELTEQRRP